VILSHSLAWLIYPFKVESFLDEKWANTHCHIHRNSPDYFGGLFGAKAVETVLEFMRPESSAVRLVRRNQTKDPGAYRFADGAIDLVRVRKDFADGYTIIINGLERYVPAIASLAHSLEIELNFETRINAYITPPNSQGFLPHFDDHDVLVLQTVGSKTWHVYENSDVRPRDLMRREAFASSDLEQPCDFNLTAGDVLYVPRGRVHAAEADAATSIHLTVGIHAPTMLTLAMRALESLSLRDDRVLARSGISI
jgi:ribosomal protein L16 Arg81 hydroxylase